MIKIKRGDGTEGFILVNSSPVIMDGDLIAGINLITDITERIQAEQALRESEERYRTLVETSPSAIVVHGANHFIFANQAALDLFGAVNFTQLGERTVLDLVPSPILGRTQNRLQQIESGAKIPLIDTQILRLDGQVVEVEAMGIPIEYQGTKAIQTVIRDITPRKRAEEQLRASEARLRMLLDEAPIAIALSRGGKFLYVNPAYREMHCIPFDEELVGCSIYEQVAPESLVASKERGRRRAKGLFVEKGYEFTALRRDGVRIPTLGAVARINLADGPANIGFFQDISERKQMENDLRESEEMYRRLVETSNEGIWAADAEQRTTFVNRQMAEMLGYSPKEMMGRRSNEFMAEESKAGYTDLIARRRRGVKEATEHKFIRKDGSVLWTLSNAVPIQDKKGKFAGSFGMLTDITALKNREKELQALNRTLRAISASNQAMMHAQSEVEFMQEVCRIVVEDCGHAMVWVGFAEDDPEKSIRPVVSAGFDEGYLAKLRLTWADTERGRGPGGTAIRTGMISMCRNMMTDPNFGIWREEALKRGYAASIVLPLLHGGKAFGELTIYSHEVDPYTTEEVHLLSELASDLAYGITMFRLRAAQEKADEALKASEEKYRSLFNGMTEGFALHEMVFDDQGRPCDYRFLELNPAFESLTGMKREEVVGRLHNDILKGDDPKWVEIYGQVVQSGQPVHFENYSPALKQHYEVFAYRPAPNQFAVLFLNITARKEMENALRQAHDELELRVDERTQELGAANEELMVEIGERQEAEEFIRQNATRAEALAEISSRLTATNLDEKAVVNIVTEMASSIIGDGCIAWFLSEDGKTLVPQAFYHPDPKMLKDGWELLKGSQPLVARRILQHVLQSGKGKLYTKLSSTDDVELAPFEYDYSPNSPGIGSCMIAPLRVEGESIGLLTLTRKRNGIPFKEIEFQFFQSMTERAALAIANARLFRNLENSLQQEQNLRKQLIQAEKNLALNRMVASVAHEINNPIQTIVNCLYLLRKAMPTVGPEHDALEMASSETKRIAGLVQQLRDLYRPGLDKSMRPLGLKAVLEDVHRLLVPHLQHHHVIWEIEDIPDDIIFNGISDQIKQVFLNLSLNAVDAMDPKGGEISVKATNDPTCSQVGVSLTDTGPGIPAENLDRIFEPFFTTKTTGTGLGLAISFDIVQNHGGRITVESQPGQGTTFTVWLPLAMGKE